ncbi:MAG: 4Fe-4S double cluster binding domain-containing protein [Candidatus Bathyarchaeia archaeon]|jgi:epoxyqueuosine reductase
MSKFVDNLFSCLEEQGFRARIVSVSHLNQLEQEIESLHIRGLLDSQFYQERLVRFSFQTPKDLPNAQSLIVVAVPRPQTRAIFTCYRQKHPLILPPTYTAYDDTKKQVQDLLAKILREKGYKYARTALPLKLLAARSGLVQYGRNNIAYSSGLGSFFQLVAAYSDMPCEVDSWQEATMMKSCEECELCRKACPTGAISSDRFLLQAERCITYHNEKKGNVLFPKWMKVSWHNCIIACMRCQKVCLQNKEVIQWVEEGEEFSAEETNLLLENVHHNKLPSTTLRKLEHLSLVDYFDSLSRNLGIFLKKREEPKFE